MTDEIEDVEREMSDVRGMIQDRVGEGLEADVEWHETVQGVVVMDMGWGWQVFWGMVEWNLIHRTVSLPFDSCGISSFH